MRYNRPNPPPAPRYRTLVEQYSTTGNGDILQFIIQPELLMIVREQYVVTLGKEQLKNKLFSVLTVHYDGDNKLKFAVMNEDSGIIWFERSLIPKLEPLIKQLFCRLVVLFCCCKSELFAFDVDIFDENSITQNITLIDDLIRQYFNKSQFQHNITQV